MHIKALRTIKTVCMMQAAVLEMTVSMKEAAVFCEKTVSALVKAGRLYEDAGLVSEAFPVGGAVRSDVFSFV